MYAYMQIYIYVYKVPRLRTDSNRTRAEAVRGRTILVVEIVVA